MDLEKLPREWIKITADGQASPQQPQSQPEDVERACIDIGASIDCIEKSNNFRNGFHEILFVWVVTSAQWMTQANLSNTILALRYIAEGLGVPTTDTARQVWFVASYSCTVGGFVLITGRLGDLYGHKNLFMFGWVWLSIWSLACGFPSGEVSFNIFRGLAGIGPSILMPNAAALLAAGWDSGERWKKNVAFVAFGATAPAGYVLGALWGAGIVQSGARWEWIFWSVAVVAAVYAVASFAVIPECGGMNVRREGGIDYLGSVVGVAGLVLVFVALNCGATVGWQLPKAGIMLGVGILSLTAFCWIETKVKEPILPMSLFQSPTFVAVATSLCLGWMSFGMFQFYFPQFAMEFRHATPLTAALQLLPVAPYGLAASSLAVYLLPRIPTSYIFLTSMLAFFFGQILLALTPPSQSYWIMSFPTILVIILGPEFSFSCGSLIASDGLTEEMQGVGGSFVNTVVNYSIALGLALAGNVERVVVAGGGDERLKGYRASWWFGAACSGLGVLMTLVFWKGLARRHAVAAT